MSKLIKGLGIFSLGFVLAIVLCFFIGFSKYQSYISSSKSLVSLLDGGTNGSALYALRNIADNIVAQQAQPVQQIQQVNYEVAPVAVPVKQPIANKQLTTQATQGRKLCEAAERYRRKNPTDDSGYINLLQNLNPKYCGENTRKDVAVMLADFSLKQTSTFRRHISFDTTLLGIFREFAKEDARVSKALANFYVVLAHDAFLSNFTKLSMSFLATSIEIHPNLPAQHRMYALLGEEVYSNNSIYEPISYSNTPAYTGQTTKASGGGVFYLIMFFVIVIFPALIYWLHYRRMRSMDIDVRMKKYDFPDELSEDNLEEIGEEGISSAVPTEIEITTTDETSHKVINLYKEKGNSSK